MKVFVAGATGAVGRPLVRMLVEAGHEVTGLTRSTERAQDLEEAGATAVVGDVLDSEAVDRAVRAAEPEAVIQQLTELPTDWTPKAMARGLAKTGRVRVVGTENLAAAARAVGARRMIGQSMAFAYRPGGGGLRSEGDPLWDDAPGGYSETVSTLTRMEGTLLDMPEGVVLRYGFLYGPGTWYARDGHQGRALAERRAPMIGAGTGVWSWVHVEDAASACVAALTGPPGIYNVVDEHPAPVNEWMPAMAAALGGKPPRRVPAWLARRVAGEYPVHMFTALEGADSSRARSELGWTPRYADWREGFALGL